MKRRFLKKSIRTLRRLTWKHGVVFATSFAIISLTFIFKSEIAQFLGISSAQASTYQFQTGYYVGDGASKSISGLGFTPEVVILKADTAGGTGAILKTIAMPQTNVAYLGVATADDTTGTIQLMDDGFIVSGTLSNTINNRYTWIAYSGSDCTSGGQLCVGTYTGTGLATKAVTTGFDPDLVLVKRSTAVAANWRTSSMPNNYAQFFMATVQDTAGAYFTTLDATGFTVGTTNNVSGGVYYYVAFKEVGGSIDVGAYTGDAVDNTSIGGVGFEPNFVFTKNANTAVSAVYNVSESYGDSSSYFTDTANLVNAIQALEVDGFQIGGSNTANGSGNTHYYAAFGGALTHSASGTFTSVSGTYTGDGNARVIDNLGFTPDLVIVKASSTQQSVFRTRMMGGDSTAYLGSATANFAGGITTLSPDGFTIGNNATVNSAGVEYVWTAYGNAWNPDTHTGSQDFTIGAYYGNGIDSRNVTRIPFQPDFVTVKLSGATAGAWRSSEHSGDTSSFFAAAADAVNVVQELRSDGFQVGTAANVNTAANLYWYFAFATSTNFAVGTYSGTGVGQNIGTSFEPDHVWVKQTGAVQGVMRTSSTTGATSFPFINTALLSNGITGIYANGFSIGTDAAVNTSGTNNYRYVVWRDTHVVGTSTYAVQTGYYVGDGGPQEIRGLGFTPDLVIIKADTTAGTGAIWKTTAMPQNNTAYLGTATADNAAGLITITSDGFRVYGTGANDVNVRFTWIVFDGSDCTSSGVFCVGRYTGDGAATKAITNGFQPNLVWVKQSTAVVPTWRSSLMPNNYAQYFSATAQNTTGTFFTTLNATGFTVGTTHNASAGVYYFATFKEVAGSIDVGTYLGNATVDRSIAGVGFQPDFVFTKNSTGAVGAVFNLNESYGDYSGYFLDGANLVDAIQALETDGFQVGGSTAAHANGVTYYYAAFGGTPDNSSSGTYIMNSGSYVGTGDSFAINDLGFKPDLVIIRGNTTQAGVFRTRMMGGDSTAYLDSATANFAGGITALRADSFTVGTNATVNTSGVTYYWTAYGNAWDPSRGSGAEDFVIGAYYGNGIDSRNITRLPFSPDFVTIKRNGATGGAWRSTAHTGDSSSYFTATANAANIVQSLRSDGFQVGTAANVNTAANVYWYFGFATSSKFTVGTYSGNGTSQTISSVGFQPDFLWVKRNGTTQGVLRMGDMTGDGALPFINTSLVSGAITGVVSNGFVVGNAAETNTSGVNNYFYAAWKLNTLDQIHYHFRADDGTEANASSLTGGIEDTTLSNVREGLPYRVRFEVSNEGGIVSSSSVLRLEYAEKVTTCSAVSSWTRVGEADGAWDMYDSSNLTQGANTTNIDEADGGVTDENSVFLNSNGGVRDTSDETGVLTLQGDEFVELEYAMTPTSFATSSTTYCFRVSAQGEPLSTYSVYPEATFAVHLQATSTGSQVAQVTIPTSNVHVGGAFVLYDASSGDTHSLTDVTITETGTVDGSTGLDNIKLFYEYDTTAPYDCASESYGGSEAQFGVTDTDSFSGPDGTSSFAGSLQASSTQAVCLYPVVDVTSGALSGETIDIEISSSDDVVLSGGDKVRLASSPLGITGSTTLSAPLLAQTHYHFRLDNGSESGASSATGGNEDTVLENLSKSTPRRIRMQVSNEGLATSNATTYRLEYAQRSGSCSATESGWTDVQSVGGAWDMYDSSNLTQGANTTNIDEADGGVTDENTVFLSANGGVRDTTSETGSLTLASNEFVEFEYSVTPLSGALEGESYCFRVTNSGTPLPRYDAYPEVSIAADVFVSSEGSHIEAVKAGASDVYVGGGWVIVDQSASRNITSITLSEQGTIDAESNLSSIRLFYEIDTSAPYNCVSESYGGSEEQYGTTVSSFSGANGTSTFTETVGISTTSSMCVYAVFNVDSTANNGDTILFELTNPGEDVLVSSGTVNPNNPVGPTGSTTVQKENLILEHYHFRYDNGNETTATSRTLGVEDTSISGMQAGVPVRLRLAVNNTGSTSTQPIVYRLQYAERVTTCSAVSSWEVVGSSGSLWSPSESTYLSSGSHTTNIGTTTGGVTDENSVFLSTNYGVIENSATTSELVLDTDEFVEFEYVIEPNTEATAGSTYCFRLSANNEPLASYATYPEVVMRTNQDFYIQRGVSDIINGTTTVTIRAGSEYVAPKASTTAFIRITNASYTGAGATSGGGTQNSNSVTTSILNPSNLTNSVSFVRTGTTNSTRIYWEIIEYIGPPGGDNEISVRAQERVTYTTTGTTVTTPTISSVSNDSDVVVFITGQQNPAANSTSYNAGISTAAWNSGSDTATFTRGITGSVASVVSYAVVEFTGSNWRIQRSEHTYSAAGSTQTESISAVNDLSRAFIHAQKRTGSNQVDDYGHEVWLSSVGQVSYLVPSTAGSIATHVSVAWIIENTQTNGSPMVVTRSNGTQAAGGVEPSSYSIVIGGTLSSLSNGSIFTNLAGLGNTTAHPQAIVGAGLTSVTNYELWISDTGSGRSYRTEVVDWPTAELTVTQNYFRFYVDDDTLTPSDPWPVGAVDLGENTTITGLDEPPEDTEHLRIRMSLAVSGASISQGSKEYKLQYGVRTTSCSAISEWSDVGDVSSTTAVWRGYNATPLDGASLSTNPPTGGDLKLSVSDRSGSYEESNNTALNPYKIYIGDDVEYDWNVEANGVTDFTSYCFRMVEGDSTELDVYTYYPTVTIAGFEVEQQDWRWFDDENSITPTLALAATNTAPSNIPHIGALKLRVLLDEHAGKDGSNAKYKLQWSEYSDFSVVHDVADRDTCTSGSRWCYFDGAGTERATITASVIYGADTCSGGVGSGCGTHNEYSYAPDIVGEVGTTTVSSIGTVIPLVHTYDDPVFIVEAITGDVSGGAGNRPAVAIITATSTSSFTVRIQEPDNEADTHGSELVSYIVMERGSYTLPDGRRVDVNTKTTSHYYGNAVSGASDDTCSFTQTFTNNPVVLASLQSDRNTGSPDFLTASVVLVTPDDFACSIEVPDGETNEPTQSEVIGWIAIEGGVFKNNNIAFEATTTSESITGWSDTPWYEQAFTQYFTGIPGVLGNKQTRYGAEGGWLRYGNTDTDSVQFAIDERDDGERTHTNEVVAYLAHFGSGALYREGLSGFTFSGSSKREFEFTITHYDARNNMTYFFRLYDTVRDVAVTATTSSGYPSLSTEGATLSFTIGGVSSGVSTEGVVTDITSTATSVPFGALTLGVPKNGAQRLTVTTNASEGYQILAFEQQDLMSGGDMIHDVTGTNEVPLPWSSGCLLSATSCYGYHVGDDTLHGGSTRFLLPDTFAALTGDLKEIAYSSGPVRNESTDIIYRVKANSGQSAGEYESRIVYIIVPVF